MELEIFNTIVWCRQGTLKGCLFGVQPSLLNFFWFSRYGVSYEFHYEAKLHWIGAQFCVCMFLDSIDKLLNMFQNVSGFHLRNFRGFRVQISET